MLDYIVENPWVLILIGPLWVGVMLSAKVLLIGAYERSLPPPPEHPAHRGAAGGGAPPTGASDAEGG